MYCNKSYVRLKYDGVHIEHHNIDFKPILTKISEIRPLSLVTGDKVYDGEDNDDLKRERLLGFSDIPTRYDDDILSWRTCGRWRKTN